MNWNPFARRHKTEPVPAAPDDASTPLPRNEDLVAAILALRENVPLGDIVPLQRAVLAARLLIPLSEPPAQTPDGVQMRPITFEDGATLAGYTDAETLRNALANTVDADRLAVGFLTGGEFCRMAEDGQFARAAINLFGSSQWALSPLVFCALARGVVLAGYPSGEDVRTGEGTLGAAVGPVPGGLPDAPTVAALRNALTQAGATRAFWYALVLTEREPCELMLSIGVAGIAVADLPTVGRALMHAWLEHGFPAAPLRVTLLDGGPDDAPIEAHGTALL